MINLIIKKMSLLKAGYLFVAGIGYTAIGVHSEMIQLQRDQREELMYEFKQQRDLLYMLKLKTLKSN